MRNTNGAKHTSVLVKGPHLGAADRLIASYHADEVSVRLSCHVIQAIRRVLPSEAVSRDSRQFPGDRGRISMPTPSQARRGDQRLETKELAGPAPLIKLKFAAKMIGPSVGSQTA